MGSHLPSKNPKRINSDTSYDPDNSEDKEEDVTGPLPSNVFGHFCRFQEYVGAIMENKHQATHAG